MDGQTGIGQYVIVGTDGNDNYAVTFIPGTYTVNQRPITVTIADHSSRYGEGVDGGIAAPALGEDYTVAITGGATTGPGHCKQR